MSCWSLRYLDMILINVLPITSFRYWFEKDHYQYCFYVFICIVYDFWKFCKENMFNLRSLLADWNKWWSLSWKENITQTYRQNCAMYVNQALPRTEEERGGILNLYNSGETEFCPVMGYQVRQGPDIFYIILTWNFIH